MDNLLTRLSRSVYRLPRLHRGANERRRKALDNVLRKFNVYSLAAIAQGRSVFMLLLLLP
jgi:hypothetical protein